MNHSLYDIKINSLNGKPYDLEQYKGKKLLIVNVASECGYTKQYAQLQELYENHGSELSILGCPCNDFGGQEPGEASEIASFCQLNYGVTFPLTEKLNIVTDTHPLYQWLTNSSLNGVSDNEVRWNFHKFLINENGHLDQSLGSGVEPLSDQILDWVKG